MKNWQEDLKANISWLLNQNPWTRYRTLLDLLDKDPNDAEVLQAKNEMLNHELINELALETQTWLPEISTRNNDPKLSYFKLRMLADFGLKHTDLNLPKTIDLAREHVIDDMFAIRGQIPERPKKGEKYIKPDPKADIWHISPCNSPVITKALFTLGLNNEQVNLSINKLKNSWTNEIGWFCHFFFVESQFKKLQIGCPIAGLMALDIFSDIPELKESEYAKHAFAPIKFHKEFGKTLYYFGRSKKFWTLKYPFVWYNALYIADVLTRFEFLKKESLVIELVEWIKNQKDENGKYKPTSVFMNYKGWDFANKREPSAWITFLCYRVLKQYHS